MTGLFLSEKNKHKIYRTAADQLAELLAKNRYPVIKTSTQPNRLLRLLDTCFTVVAKSSQYNIAIVPFYSGYRSLLLQAIVSYLLKLIGKKLVVVIHGGGLPMYMKAKPSVYLKVLHKADLLVAPSNFLIQELKQYGLQIELIENVLNLKEYQFHLKQNLKPNLFWMRTFEDIYNPLMAVRVLALLQHDFPHAKMMMAGRDAGMFLATKELVKKLQLLDSVVFPGYVSIADKNKIAAKFDIYLCTNNVDNAPVSLIEMMAFGMVVISTNAGGIPYLATNNFNALLVDVDADNAMVDAIKLVLENNMLAKQLVQNASKTAQQYDEAPVLQKWQSLFLKLGYA